MPLSPEERDRLREIEEGLKRDHPDLDAARDDHVTPDATRRFWYRLAMIAAVAALAVVVLVAFTVGVAQAGVLLLFILATTAFVSLGARATGPPGGRSR
ncbi:DUF3040 domain-containing protein [Catellatospora sp. NPDC049609]|uniref:DUF3040 domain-containing protein n=1 Tax=Catellatospora sp. NPDC049609 TaxID=3155505 RepID=UPI003414AC82